MFGTAAWSAPTAHELMARFALGEHAELVDDFVELVPRGPRHQPRLRRGTRVRILETTILPGASEPEYGVEVLDGRGRRSGYWAIVPQRVLADAPELPFLDWLRSLRA